MKAIIIFVLLSLVALIEANPSIINATQVTYEEHGECNIGPPNTCLYHNNDAQIVVAQGGAFGVTIYTNGWLLFPTSSLTSTPNSVTLHLTGCTQACGCIEEYYLQGAPNGNVNYAYNTSNSWVASNITGSTTACLSTCPALPAIYTNQNSGTNSGGYFAVDVTVAVQAAYAAGKQPASIELVAKNQQTESAYCKHVYPPYLLIS